MRFLISILFFGSLCMIPFQGHTKPVDSSICAYTFGIEFPFDSEDEILIPVNKSDMLCLGQYRSENITIAELEVNKENAASAFLYQNLAFDRNNSLMPFYLVDQSRGLLLIFPEHYFF